MFTDERMSASATCTAVCAEETDSGSLRIREAELSDAPAIAGLLTELGYPACTGFAHARIAAIAGRRRERILVAEQAGSVAGFLSLHCTPLMTESAPAGRVTALCIGAPFRSTGIGAQLLAEAERIARSWGCGKMEVTTSAHRTRAHAFYEREGYEECPKLYRKTFFSLGGIEA